MSIRKITTAAVLGLTVMAAAPALAEPAADTANFLTQPGIGVTDHSVGNAKAAGEHLFWTGERPRQLERYHVESGTYELRDGATDKTKRLSAQGPEIDFGIDVL